MTTHNSSFSDGLDTSAGERLREAREELELSIEEVARQTRLTRDVLRALEAMQTENVSPTFLRMHASTYARFLDLPASEIADAYAAQRKITNADALPSSRMETREPLAQRLVWPAAVASAVLVIGVFGLFSLTPRSQTEAELPVYRQVVANDAAATPLATLTAMPVKRELSIRAISSGWIEVRGSDGTIFRNRVMRSGETYYPRMQAGWTVTVRDAGAFEWWLGDLQIGPVGEHGQSLYSASVDEALAVGEEMISTALAAQSEAQPPR